MTDRRIRACGACGCQGSIGVTGHPISVYWGECMHCHVKSAERLSYHEALIEWNGMNCTAETDVPPANTHPERKPPIAYDGSLESEASMVVHNIMRAINAEIFNPREAFSAAPVTLNIEEVKQKIEAATACEAVRRVAEPIILEALQKVAYTPPAVRGERSAEVQHGLDHFENLARIGSDRLKAAWEYIRSLEASAQGWRANIEDVGEKQIVQRWHKVWNCPVSVRRVTKAVREHLNIPEGDFWLERTGTTYWPDEAFTPHWQPLPPPPVEKEGG